MYPSIHRGTRLSTAASPVVAAAAAAAADDKSRYDIGKYIAAQKCSLP